MIEQKYTRIFNTEHRPVETGAVFVDEGIAAVFVKEGDQTVVRPSTGAAGEKFAGLSQSRNVPPLFIPFVYEGVVDGDLKMPRIPMAGQILVRVAGEAKTVGADAPVDASAVKVEADVVTFHASHTGQEVYVQMMYEPTVSEARQFNGDAPVGGLSSTAQGIIGLTTKGDVATSYYDASVDWAPALTASLGPDGKLTVGGSGAKVDGTIVSAPSPSNPFLVIKLS